MNLLQEFSEEVSPSPTSDLLSRIVETKTKIEELTIILEMAKKTLAADLETAYSKGLAHDDALGGMEIVERRPASSIVEMRIPPEVLAQYQQYCRDHADVTVTKAGWKRFCEHVGEDHPLDDAVEPGRGTCTYVLQKRRC